MPSTEHEALVGALLATPGVTEAPTLAQQRADYDAMLGQAGIPADVQIEPITVAACAADWVSVGDVEGAPVVLYLHGGGYVIGSNVGYREFAGRLARGTGARICVLNYRLAPEHPFPAAVDDGAAAYRWLLEQGIAAKNIVIAGDSAGGGLALATLLSLREAGVELPAAAVCLSPWTDLPGTGESNRPGAVDDPLIADGALEGMRAQYAPDDLTHPLASPHYGDLAGLPPLMIMVGTREKLLDDSRRLVQLARHSGVEVDYFEGEGLIHVWPVVAAAAPESAAAIDRVAAFLQRHCG
jgi:monoterpene epsilon-lactone hydrolase